MSGILEPYRQLCGFLNACMGADIEARLYDLAEGGLPEHALLLIEGAKFRDEPYLSYTDTDGVGHSAFFIKDENGTMAGLLCLSRGFSELLALRDGMQAFFSAAGLDTGETAPVADVGEYVRAQIEKLIPGGVPQARAMSLTDKQKLLSALSERGVFNIKKAVEQAVSLLDMSQATVYSYVKKAGTQE